MNKSIPTSWRVSQKARGTIMLRAGVAILVAETAAAECPRRRDRPRLPGHL